MKKYIAIGIVGICLVGGICGYMFHPHSYKVVEATEATCTESGSQTYKCWCGKTYIDEVPATGHSYSEEITKEPTCTEAGEKTYKCSLCGDSYTENIKALGHEYIPHTDSIDADNCLTQKCSLCGDEIKEEHSYNYKDTASGKDYSCDICEYTLFSVTEYSESKTMYMQSKGDAYDLPLDNANVKQSYSSGDTVSIAGETGDYYVTISDNDGIYFIKASLLTDKKPAQPAKELSQSAQSSQPASEPQPTPEEEQAWLDSLGGGSSTMEEVPATTGSDGSSFAGIEFY